MAADDIEYRPVMTSDNEGITDTKRGSFNRLQLSLCIVLVISAVLQFIAIVTPGWRITSNTSLKLSSYESVFYTTSCLTYNETIDECATISFHDSFRRLYDDAGDAAKASLVRTYNLVVQNQINVQIVWVLTVCTIVFQVFKLTRPNEGFPRLTFINTIALTCACLLMFQVLFKAFVEVDTHSRLTEHISISTGFPYSLFFYCITFFQTIACLVLIVKQVFDQLRKKDQRHAETNVMFDRLKLEYEAEVDAFKRYRLKSRLRPESGGSYRGDRRSRGENGGSHTPRHSPRPRDRSPPREHNRDHSPRRRHGSPPREYNRDHSPRRRDRSPPREHNRDHSPRRRNRSPPREHNRDHSPRRRDRSPPREHNRDHSPRRRDRSPPRENNRDHSPRLRHRSPPREHYKDHSPRPRNRSPQREHYRNHSPKPNHRSSPRLDRGDHSRHRSPPREIRDNHSPRHRSPPREDGEQQSARDSRNYDNPALVVTPPVEVHPVIVSSSQDTPVLDQSAQSNDNTGVAVEDESDAKTEDIELSTVKL